MKRFIDMLTSQFLRGEKMLGTKKLAAGLALAGALAIGGGARAASFSNGGFEMGTDPGGSFISLNAGSTDITGWDIGGAGVDYIGGYWMPSQGERSVDLSQLSAGWVEQAFDTTAGTFYVVLFDLAGNTDGGPTVKTVRVTAAADSANYTFDTTGMSRASMGWVTMSFTFQATGASTTLRFTSLDETPFGPALDNVRVNAVPEPASLAMAGVGAVCVVGLARRRRRA